MRIANGQGRGIVPAGHPLLVTRARAAAFREADLVLVAGAPLDFRLGYGQFGPALRRAFDAGVPYLVNVVTDPEIAYPRATTGA